MRINSNCLSKLALSILLFLAGTAHSTSQETLDRYLRDHSIEEQEVSTWDLMLVEDKGSKTPIHVGMAFRDSNDKLWVLEAIPYLGVQQSSFTTFTSQNRNHNIYALRPQDTFMDILNRYDKEFFWQYFNEHFHNRPYNFSMIYTYYHSGVQHYYCSQLVREMYNFALSKAEIDIMPLKKMLFHEAFARQIVLSQGYPVPFGEPGVSPADFANHNFRYLGYLLKHSQELTQAPKSKLSWEENKRNEFFLRKPNASEDDFEEYLEDEAMTAWAS